LEKLQSDQLNSTRFWQRQSHWKVAAQSHRS